jgi:hypothetical protein
MTRAILISLLFLVGCGLIKKEDNKKYQSFPYFPDTSAYPELQVNWDRTLSNSNVYWLGAYGVWENGGGFMEIANEIELHLDQSEENIYQ